MTRTYTRTMMMDEERIQKATIKIYLTESVKWEAADEEEKVVTYTGLKSWSIVDGEDAKEIEAHTDGSCIDEMHEYLVLDFVDGTQATFRNSHVDMFIR